jgi:hypothetical protein
MRAQQAAYVCWGVARLHPLAIKQEPEQEMATAISRGVG